MVVVDVLVVVVDGEVLVVEAVDAPGELVGAIVTALGIERGGTASSTNAAHPVTATPANTNTVMPGHRRIRTNLRDSYGGVS